MKVFSNVVMSISVNYLGIY